jgi:glutamate/tyrosine decarboxylase-like PLP-dependent enzyme
LISFQALEAALDPHSCGFIVGTAGTVGTGSIDDFQSIADLCATRPNDLWFHIDGAIGAVARCSKRLRPLLNGFERADSIAFDLHKWLFVPYECGCILIRNGQLHKSTFCQPPASYLTLMDGGITPSEGEVFFSDYGLELSRNMKSLKVWMTLKTYGIEKFGQIMEQNVDQAKYFVKLIEQHSDQFEVLATGPLNIVCFRYIVSHLNVIDLDILNKLNKQLLVTVQERGIAVVSPIVINNEKFALRMCITNHRTKMSDMDWFMEQLIQLTNEMLNLPEYSFLKN